ncbi:MAG: FecR family protein [Porticoccaceae bacterium]|nr:FecR family protein [Porticoccaceae bacterium]
MVAKLNVKSLFVIFALVFGAPAFASGDMMPDNQWQVVELTGHVQHKPPGMAKWIDVEANATLTAPLYLKTSDDAHILLSHRNDSTRIGPNSTIQFAAEKVQSTGLFMRVAQSLGHALFKIESGQPREIEVATPYLVTVVKGTTFSVQVSDEQAIVNLIDGLLEVSAPGLSEQVILKTGQLALMAAGAKSITVIDPTTPPAGPDANNSDANNSDSVSPANFSTEVITVVGQVISDYEVIVGPPPGPAGNIDEIPTTGLDTTPPDDSSSDCSIAGPGKSGCAPGQQE